MLNDPTANAAARPDAIILAAGQGKRMGGDLPKVLFPICDRPMVRWVIDACFDAGVGRCILIVGYKGELVREAVADDDRCVFAEQHEQLGTGHATDMAAPLFENLPPRDVFVLAGDGPLIRGTTLKTLLDTHRQTQAGVTLATALLDDPSGYGRVLRTADGDFDRIVEQKDATPDQLAVREVNPSYYCFQSAGLFGGLKHIDADNAQREFYLTDVPAWLKSQGKPVSLTDAVPPEDVLSINTQTDLAKVDDIMKQRLAKERS